MKLDIPTCLTVPEDATASDGYLKVISSMIAEAQRQRFKATTIALDHKSTVINKKYMAGVINAYEEVIEFLKYRSEVYNR